MKIKYNVELKRDDQINRGSLKTKKTVPYTATRKHHPVQRVNDACCK